MPGDMKPGPFQKLLDEATELGIDTTGYDASPGSVERLKAYMARKAEEIATAAASRAKMESMEIAPAFDEDEDDEFAGFDEAAGATRGVLVRLVEFTEWVPVAPDDKVKGLTVANGFSGFEAGEHEKVVSIESIDSNRHKRVPLDDDPEQFVEYTLVVFKVVLANNVTTDLLHQMIDLQGGNREGQEPSGKLHIPDARQPNRAQRRGKMN